MSNRKLAIVTGGGRGIGKAFCLRLGDMGYNVVVNHSNPGSADNAAAVVKELEAKGVEAIAVQADITKFEECENLINTACERFGDTIDVLVNNSAAYHFGMPHELTWEQHVHQLRVDLEGPVAMTYLALPHMMDRDTCIVNISSVGGLTPVANSDTYCAAKHGLIGWTKAIAKDYATKGVRCNAIAPGNTMTDMLMSGGNTDLDFLAGMCDMKKIGDVEDMADAMEYIIGAKFLTGQTISPNGGWAY